MEILIASIWLVRARLKVSPGLSEQAALLHDVPEDTKTTKKELQEIYSEEDTNAVSALTKNTLLPKEEKCLNCDSDDSDDKHEKRNHEIQNNHTHHSSDNICRRVSLGWRTSPAA